MTAGILQLAAKGNEDLYLINDPQITYFKLVYKRYSNFAIESIPQNFNSIPDFGKQVTCTLSKNADLINKIYVVITLPKINCIPETNTLLTLNKCAWIKYVGWYIIKSVEIEIGSYVIDKHYGDWLYIWNELTTKNNTLKSINKMIGNVDELTSYTENKDSYVLYIPLLFWFCRDIGLALPIVALEFSDVKININFAKLDEILKLSPTHYIDIENNIVHFKVGDILYQKINNNVTYIQFVYFDNKNNNIHRLYYNKITPNTIIGYDNVSNKSIYKIKSLDDKYNIDIKQNSIETIHINKQTNFNWINNLCITDVKLLVDYIYLDTTERYNFIHKEHNYIIDVLIFDNDKLLTNNSTKLKYSYKCQCKEFIIRAHLTYLEQSNFTIDYFMSDNILTSLKIIMNGIERLNINDINYYNLIQNYQYHSNTSPKGVFLYSFSLFPVLQIPYGICNLNKIDDLQFIIQVHKSINYLNSAKIRVYALGISNFKVMNGYCELINESNRIH